MYEINQIIVAVEHDYGNNTLNYIIKWNWR